MLKFDTSITFRLPYLQCLPPDRRTAWLRLRLNFTVVWQLSFEDFEEHDAYEGNRSQFSTLLYTISKFSPNYKQI